MKLCCKLINLKTPSEKIVQSSMYENYWLAFALFYVIQVLTGNSINTVRINYRVHITTTLRIIQGCSMQIQFEYIPDQDNHSFGINATYAKICCHIFRPLHPAIFENSNVTPLLGL